VIVGCGGSETGDEGREAETPSDGPKVEDPGPIHVHGLGINPKDDALFIATHTGLFRAPEGETTAKRVADRYQDTMGFTVVGPDRFLGSGHPDGREDLPPFLGLIRSGDGGRTWQEVSLMGESDFHVLEASGSRVYGFGSDYDSQQPEFLVSDDGGRSWEKRSPPGAIVSLAISPDDSERLVAAVQGGPADDGLYESEDGGAAWQPLTDQTGLLGWTAADRLYLVDVDGVVSRSSDGGTTWEEVGESGGQPAAFETAGNDLLVALHDGTVKRSTEGGRTWTVRSRPRATVTRGAPRG
jgi:photosystem II stability/assembly factor-like uncharacterized protein